MTQPRSIFRPVFMGGPSFSVKPITLALNHDEIPEGELAIALKNAVPQGFVGTSPYVVKTLDGEYLVYADGTAQFVPLGNSPGERVSLNGGPAMPVMNSGVILGRLDPIQVHLSQDDFAPSNRLLDVRVNVLLSRGAPLIPPVVRDARYTQFISNMMLLLGIRPGRGLGYSGETIKALFQMPPDIWTEEETESVRAAAATPSNEELQDVALVDSLYTWPLGGLPTKISWTNRQKSVAVILDQIVCGKEQVGWRRTGYVGPGFGNPFYCTGASQEGLFRFRGWPSTAAYFGLKPDEEWGHQRLATHNAKIFSDVLRTYPFPRPIPLAPGFWYEANRQKLAELVNNGLIYDETLARFFITLITLDTYNAVSALIIDWAEKRAERQQKWAIIRIAATVALAAIFSAALTPALAAILPAGVPVSAATVASAMTQFAREKFTEADLERMAKGLEEAVKIFEVNDPLFAEEATVALATLDWLSGEFTTSADTLSQMQDQAENPPPTPEEFGVNTEYPESSPLEKALLGVGGAAGVAGLILLLLR